MIDLSCAEAGYECKGVVAVVHTRNFQYGAANQFMFVGPTFPKWLVQRVISPTGELAVHLFNGLK